MSKGRAGERGGEGDQAVEGFCHQLCCVQKKNHNSFPHNLTCTRAKCGTRTCMGRQLGKAWASLEEGGGQGGGGEVEVNTHLAENSRHFTLLTPQTAVT